VVTPRASRSASGVLTRRPCRSCQVVASCVVRPQNSVTFRSPPHARPPPIAYHRYTAGLRALAEREGTPLF